MLTDFSLFGDDYLEIFQSDSQATMVDFLAFFCYIAAVIGVEDITMFLNMKIKEISNEKLLNMCKVWGKMALGARNKFIGLLPEVNKRKLYAKKFVSIFHFAAVMAGVSREQVQSALNLANVFEKMPNLLALLVDGVVSVNKLRRVVSVATVENEAELANLVQTLSKAALETFVRDILMKQARDREAKTVETQIKDGLFEPQNTPISWPGPDSEYTIKVQNSQPFEEYVSNPPLNNSVKKKLNELAQKGIDINELIDTALAQREVELAEDKQRAAEKAKQKLIAQITEEKPISRAAPVATIRLLKREHGTKCAEPFCTKPAVEIHHTDRFAMSKIHNPNFMAPLCRQHHQIAHAIDTKVIEKKMQ